MWIFVSCPCKRIFFILCRQTTAKKWCGCAVVASFVIAFFLPMHCTVEKHTWFECLLGWVVDSVVRLLADNKPMLKCKGNANVTDAMVQMISLRTKSAVWFFLLIGTCFICELECREILRNVRRGFCGIEWREIEALNDLSSLARALWGAFEEYWDACKEYLHTESMLQMLQNLSSVLLFPCALSMAFCHALQSAGICSDTVWLEYIISICLTGCSFCFLALAVSKSHDAKKHMINLTTA